MANVSSQWSTNGTSVYYNTGNVGIGTTTPDYKLDVAGAINASSVLVNGVPVGTGSGSVSNVSAGTGLTGGNITTAGTLNVDVGRAANKILQLKTPERADSRGRWIVTHECECDQAADEKYFGD